MLGLGRGGVQGAGSSGLVSGAMIVGVSRGGRKTNRKIRKRSKSGIQDVGYRVKDAGRSMEKAGWRLQANDELSEYVYL